MQKHKEDEKMKLNEHKCDYKQKLTNATAQFPIPTNTKINLYTLKNKIELDKYILVSNGNPSYVGISICIEGNKNSFNVFENGKCVCWHSVSPKAWRPFLDYFYYAYVINALCDTK